MRHDEYEYPHQDYRSNYPEQYRNHYQNEIRGHFNHPENYPEHDQNRWSRNRSTHLPYDKDYQMYSSEESHRRSTGYRGKGPKGYKRTDDKICEDVCEKLMDSPYVNAENIEVKVQKGCVALTGHVDNKRIKYFVEDLIDNVYGVTEVKNDLSVKRAHSSQSDDSYTDESLFQN